MPFCRELRFVAIYALFGDFWAKKVPFWVKNNVSWARSALLHGINCIFMCKFVCFEILSRFGRIFTLVTSTRLFATVS